jgi:hypothetical protein
MTKWVSVYYRRFCCLALALLVVSFLTTAKGEAQVSISHFVEVGDSWQALAGRYGLTV